MENNKQIDKTEELSSETDTTKQKPSFLDMLLPFMYIFIQFSALGALLIFKQQYGTKFTTLDTIIGIFSAFACIAMIFMIIKNLKRFSFISNRYIFSVVLALNSLIMPEIILNSYPQKGSVLYWILGFALCLILYMLGSAVLPNPKVWYIILSVLFTIYTLMQFYIYVFRGEPVRFADLFNLRSATAIQSEYKFFICERPLCAIINLALMIVLIVKMKIQKNPIKTHLITGGAVIVCAVIFYFAGSFAFNMGIRNRHIKLGFSGSENYATFSNIGFDLMFYFDGMYNRVQIPDNYSDEKAVEILSQYKTEEAENKPIIIAVLNESFADFEHIADFKTNTDYMPNYHKLKSESVSGYVTVSAYGGYTCNSEYEFLTGNTMAFLPSGSAAYTQYLNNKQDSIVSYLNSIGYETKAITPCEESLWEIDKAYENLQFDTSIFRCANLADKVEKINGNISDKTVYGVVEKEISKLNSGKPVFAWVTTMQNHGPYADKTDIGNAVSFEDYNNSDAIKYLNSIYESDKALGELVDHYRNSDKEVVIVMFGDHYPHIPEFTEHLYGNSITDLSTADYSRLHQTPFFIWDNKGTETKEIDDISLNYLSNEVMKVADIPLAPYQQELEKVRKSLPIISGFGYKTCEGQWFETNDIDDSIKDIRNEYHTMQYYRMFAEK